MDVILYTAEDGKVQLEVQLEKDTVWLTQDQMDHPTVLVKKEAALKWCANASEYSHSYGGKPWRYLLIPHNEIATNITLEALAARFGD